MRFIVDIYRYIILAFCGAIVIGGTLLLLAVFDQRHQFPSSVPPLALALVFGGLAFLVLNLGGIAIFMSIHDRHAELVEELGQTNEALAKIAQAIGSQSNV
jgi:hypothetical protein